MSRIRNHIDTIAIEDLNSLRDRLFKAFSSNIKNTSRPTKSRNSRFYGDLKDEIKKETGIDISEGTLLKFFYDDINRKYQLITIDVIEDYIEKKLSTYKIDNTIVNPLETIKLEETDQELKNFATKIYIELTTRKAAIPIDENHDVIEEIYNSWFKLFCIIRDEMKLLPAHCFKDFANPESIIGMANKILNDVLRPHLTEHQAKYRSWLESAKRDSENKNLTPQELQKKYLYYESLMNSIKEINKILFDSASGFLNWN